jgi:L-gulono-1,4-lactone dehydrogenase
MPTNWAGTHSCVPVAYERPASRAEVIDAVGRATAAGRVVRAIGAAHSFSDAAMCDGTLLSLERLDRVLDVDRPSGLVRVEGGISLRALGVRLLEHGLALPNLGDIDAQSLAGAIATATHGTGIRFQNLSASVAGLELVLADGTERTLTVDDGDLLRAARVGLGSLGIVVAVTLRCVPAFRLHAVDRPLPLEDVLASLEEHLEANEHFEFWTFPHSPVALTAAKNRTEAPVSTPGPARAWISDALLDNHVFEALCRVARRVPRAIPRLTRFAGDSASRRERVDWSSRIFANPRYVRFNEMEYAVPREHGVEALRAAREVLERHPVVFPIEFRLVAADDALLSPAHDRDVACLSVHNYRGMPWEAPFRDVEAAMRGVGGRPHWGKVSFLTAAELQPLYPRWEAFQAARSELDPDGRFETPYAERVLGRPPRPAGH